ncbi:MAG TPA: four helix bundle protein [Patescibacteria group bacterium]|nr:four helix bundle protein [Patescibacteria group bacterium]
MAIKDFKEVFVWQKAHQLALAVYKITAAYPKDEVYGLVSQTRRAAVSIPSNIAEGFKRFGVQDDVRFCNIAQGSLEEIRYQILLAKDLGYINAVQYGTIESLSVEVAKLLTLWLKSKPQK